jgi:hypothetical protein
MKTIVLTALALALLPMAGLSDNDVSGEDFGHPMPRNNANLFKEGRHIFRYDTFGDEVFWGDALKLHLALAGTNNGGVGPVSARRLHWRWDSKWMLKPYRIHFKRNCARAR